MSPAQVGLDLAQGGTGAEVSRVIPEFAVTREKPHALPHRHAARRLRRRPPPTGPPPPPPPAGPCPPHTPAEARTIAKEAYTYGYPMVDGYRILYAYFVDRENPEFKAPWNQVRNIPRVYTPEDTTVQTPNSDTPYS